MKSTERPPLPALVSAAWLAAHLRDPDLVVLDCSWYLPSAGRDADAEYHVAHIPGALRFDLDAASDPASSLPHMLPKPAQFAAMMERMGIASTDRVVCYDGSGTNLSAARVWWMFRVFGHRSVAVLDGGFRAWSGATRQVQRGVTRRPPTGYPIPSVDESLIRSRGQVEAAVAAAPAVQVVDARPAVRFRGEVAEPRAGVARGHIEGSRNVPFTDLSDPDTGLLRRPSELLAILRKNDVDPGQPIIALCGSGTSACALGLAIEVLRQSGTTPVAAPVAVYDGSWSEWGMQK